MQSNRKPLWLLPLVILLPNWLLGSQASPHKTSPETQAEKTIGVSVDPADGTYTIFDPVSNKPILHSRVAAEIDHHWLRSTEYPQH
jgi:hypothetical protein